MENFKQFFTLAFFTLAALSGACGTEGQDGESTFGSGNTTVGEGASTDSGSENGGGSQTNGSQSGEGQNNTQDTEVYETGYDPKFDLGAIPDAALVNPGCKKVDLVFVVDNSGSMEAKQAKLNLAFEGFALKLASALEDVDSYHVMVVSTDNFIEWDCQQHCGEFDHPCQPLEAEMGGDPCTDVLNPPWWGNIGCGVHNPVGNKSSWIGCLPPGTTYLEGGPEDLTDGFVDKFTCMAQLGISGDEEERPLLAAQVAVSNIKNAEGGCNDGFLRDDAILVVVVITDEEDKSAPFAITLGNGVVNHKKNPQDAVFFGLLPFSGQVSYDCNPGDGIEGVNKRLLDFAGTFAPNRRYCGPINAFSFGAFFDHVVDTQIVSSCKQHVPG